MSSLEKGREEEEGGEEGGEAQGIRRKRYFKDEIKLDHLSCSICNVEVS